ncbi:MAG: hypothetical protein ACRENP_17450 [Longimicrobiales bacterium]
MPPQSESGQFTYVNAGQQVAVERFTRTAETIESDLRIVSGLRVTFSARVTGGTVTQVLLRAFSPTDSVTPAQTATVRIGTDTLTLETVRSGAPIVDKLPVPAGVVPYLDPSAVWMEEIVKRAKVLGGTSVRVPIAILSAPQQIATAAVTFTSPTQVRLESTNVSVLLTLDEAGRILRGEVPSQGVVFTRSTAAR